MANKNISKARACQALEAIQVVGANHNLALGGAIKIIRNYINKSELKELELKHPANCIIVAYNIDSDPYILQNLTCNYNPGSDLKKTYKALMNERPHNGNIKNPCDGFVSWKKRFDEENRGKKLAYIYIQIKENFKKDWYFGDIKSDDEVLARQDGCSYDAGKEAKYIYVVKEIYTDGKSKKLHIPKSWVVGESSLFYYLALQECLMTMSDCPANYPHKWGDIWDALLLARKKRVGTFAKRRKK